MNWTVVVIVCLVVAMFVGPIMIMQPSGRQRYVAKLRTQASKMGLRVQMAKLNGDMTAVYGKPWPLTDKRKQRIPSWRLDKMGYEHEIHLAQYWHLSDVQELPASLKAALPELLAKLPEDVQAVEVSPSGVQCYWNERGGEPVLRALADWLDQFIQLMIPYTPPVSTD